MNEVSIIINGVRYDFVRTKGSTCENCDLRDKCKNDLMGLCCEWGEDGFYCFKKSDKKFEP